MRGSFAARAVFAAALTLTTAVSSGATTPAAPTAATGPADLLIVGARVHAPGGGVQPGDAVAVRGERIVAVGRGAELAALRGPATRVIDAGGRTLLPGLQDGHVHFVGGATAMQRVVLDGARDVPEIQGRIREWVAANPGDGWVVGRGWMYAAFGAAALPHRRELDAVVPDRPAIMYGADGHTAWANTKALELAGIGRDTADPPNGTIVRDADGTATGTLKEAAMNLVGRLVPAPTREQRLAALRGALALAASRGVVRVHSLGGDFQHLELLDELRREGALPVRFDVAISVGPPGLTDEQRREIEAAQARWTGDRVAFGGVKLMLDGVIDSKTAALLEPYADGATRGDLFWKRDDFVRTVTELDRRGVQMSTHAIGDASVRLALDAYEAAARANGRWTGRGERRHKIEHVEVVALKDVGRFRALGVTASFQPLHSNPDPAWLGVWEQNLGPVRTERGFAWALFERAGANVAFGSDFPVVTIDPWPGLQMAVARQYVTPEGVARPPGGFVPAQRVTLAQALDAYTINVARALNREADEGSIAPGRLADLVLVDRDLAATPPLELAATNVLYTIVGGRVVHEASSAAAREREVNYVLTGRVASVEDGDTLTLETRDGTRFRVRLSDIDTPETYDEAQPNAQCPCAGRAERLGQPRGVEAGAALRALADGRAARAECYSIDRYGRPICHVAVDGRDVSLEQARAGWAWASERAEWVRRPETRRAVEDARAARRGLWADADPLPPWTWRRGCWNEGRCPGAVGPPSAGAAR